MKNYHYSFCMFIALLALLAGSTHAHGQWTKAQSFNNGKVNVIRANGNFLLAGTDTSGIFLSVDYGQTWTDRSTGLASKNIVDLLFKNTTILACIGDGNMSGNIALSRNNSLSWQPPAGNYYGFAFCLAQQEDSVLMGTWFGITKSTDDGDTWSGFVHTGLPSNALVATMLVNGSDIFAGVTASSVGGEGIFRSSDNGATWVKKSTGITSNEFTAIARNGSKLFAATNGGGVFISTNNGDSWTAANNGLTSLAVYSLMISGNNMLAGTGDGIFLSANDGANWTNISTGLPTGTVVRAIATNGPMLIIGTDSTIWRRTTAEVITGIASIENKINVNIYPNPGNGNFTIDLPAETTAKTITVTNAAGQTVYENLAPGFSNANSFELSLPQTATGVYFIQIQTTGGTAYQRLLVK